MAISKNPFSNYSPYEILAIERRKRLVLGACQRSIIYTLGLSPFLLVFLANNFSLQLLVTISLLLGVLPIAIISKMYAQTNRPEVASLALISYLIIILFANTFLVEGFHRMMVPGYMVIIILSGMILPPARTFQVAGVISLLFLIYQVLSSYDLPWIEFAGEMGDLVITIIVVIAFFVSAISIDMSTRDLRKALEDATDDLVTSNKELAKASEMKSQFTARTSHELKTPLSSIIVFTDLALREAYGPLNQKLTEALELVVASARKLRTIINNILDISKIEAGELELDSCPTQIRDLVRRVISEHQAAAEKKNLQLNVEVSENVPIQIDCDDNRIIQIIDNLISNSIKFTDVGFINLIVSMIDNDHWCIEVSDSGKGIPFDHQQHVYKPYYSLEPVSGALNSTGLGLAITYRLVTLMEGNIELDSRLGRGTNIKIVLPLLRDKSVSVE